MFSISKRCFNVVKYLGSFSNIAIRLNHSNLNVYSAEKLNNRDILRVSGEDCSEFLQGLVTNDIKSFEDGSTNSLYAIFLNNRGRILYDTIIYRGQDNNTFLVECDSSGTKQLMKHLNLYKVRRKIQVASMASEVSVWAIYNTGLIDQCIIDGSLGGTQEVDKFDINCIQNSTLVVPDPRLPALGYRAIIKSDASIDNLPNNDAYRLCRYKLGVGEGISELEVGQSFTLEMNCDFLNGISFDKGCYIGQELTARTFHTGVVRKRLMPIVFEEEVIGVPYNSPIEDEVNKKSPTGKLKGYCGKYGLGLMRVTETLGSQSLRTINYKVKSYVPYWWPAETVKQKYMTLNR